MFLFWLLSLFGLFSYITCVRGGKEGASFAEWVNNPFMIFNYMKGEGVCRIPPMGVSKCPIELYKLVNNYFDPFEDTGITKTQIDDAVYAFENSSPRLKGMAIVQVIGNEIYIDDRLMTTSPSFEWARLKFILARLEGFLGQRALYCKSLFTTKCDQDFEFILDLKDCQTCGRPVCQELNPPSNSLSREESENKYRNLPIMSITKCDNTAFIPLPQWNEARDGLFENWDHRIKTFQSLTKKSSYEEKQNQIVFRGSFSTYSSFDIDGNYNPTVINEDNWQVLGRSKLLHLGWHRSDLFNIAIKVIRGHRYIFDGYSNRFGVNYLSMLDQALHYRHVIYTEGWCGWADRLKHLLFYNSTILMQETPCREYYADLLIPKVHYIPVKGSFQDLVPKAGWIKANGRIGKEMALNAVQFGETFLCKDSIQCYINLIFSKYSSLVKYKPKRNPLAKRWNVDLYS